VTFINVDFLLHKFMENSKNLNVQSLDMSHFSNFLQKGFFIMVLFGFYTCFTDWSIKR
jgi:hypothetical protein